jgi:SUZ domain
MTAQEPVTTPSVAPKNVMVMKRNTSAGRMSDAAKADLAAKSAESAVDKEKAYAEARARIFAEEANDVTRTGSPGLEKGGAPASTTPPLGRSGPPVNPPVSAGSRGPPATNTSSQKGGSDTRQGSQQRAVVKNSDAEMYDPDFNRRDPSMGGGRHPGRGGGGSVSGHGAGTGYATYQQPTGQMDQYASQQQQAHPYGYMYPPQPYMAAPMTGQAGNPYYAQQGVVYAAPMIPVAPAIDPRTGQHIMQPGYAYYQQAGGYATPYAYAAQAYPPLQQPQQQQQQQQQQSSGRGNGNSRDKSREDFPPLSR